MMGTLENGNKAPLLLETSRRGSASLLHASGNIIVSIVGTGVLGLPYAFKISGWCAGLVSIFLVAFLTYYCMMLQVKCRKRLEQQDDISVVTYGDLAANTCGKMGRYVAEIMVVISQFGGGAAYYLFAAQNLSSVFTGSTDFYRFFILVLIPVQLTLSFIRRLSSLGPLSLLADTCNVAAMGIMVVVEIITSFQGRGRASSAVSFKGWQALPFVIGTSTFCFDGFAMVLSLEGSMKRPEKFGKVLGRGLFLIAFVYALFGLSGYLCYGEETQDIVTLNLANDWYTMSIKLGLCVAVILTCPVLMHPVFEMSEAKLYESVWLQRYFSSSASWVPTVAEKAFRAISILVLAVVAAFVPGFGIFVSLMGSTVSALLGFVFPALSHLKAFKGSLGIAQTMIDVAIVCWGLVFAIYGTYTTCIDVFGN